MSYIPDTRYRKVLSLYEGTKGDDDKDRDNYYWQGYLNEADSRHVAGYDECIDDIRNLFNNLDTFNPILEAMGLDTDKVFELINAENKTDTFYLSDLSDEDLENTSKEEKFIQGFKESALIWLEMERDELIVSMIDNMTENEYELHKKNVDETGYKNAVLRRIENVGKIFGLSDEKLKERYGDYEVTAPKSE